MRALKLSVLFFFFQGKSHFEITDRVLPTALQRNTRGLKKTELIDENKFTVYEIQALTLRFNAIGSKVSRVFTKNFFQSFLNSYQLFSILLKFQ